MPFISSLSGGMALPAGFVLVMSLHSNAVTSALSACRVASRLSQLIRG